MIEKSSPKRNISYNVTWIHLKYLFCCFLKCHTIAIQPSVEKSLQGPVYYSSFSKQFYLLLSLFWKTICFFNLIEKYTVIPGCFALLFIPSTNPSLLPPFFSWNRISLISSKRLCNFLPTLLACLPSFLFLYRSLLLLRSQTHRGSCLLLQPFHLIQWAILITWPTSWLFFSLIYVFSECLCSWQKYAFVSLIFRNSTYDPIFHQWQSPLWALSFIS